MTQVSRFRKQLENASLVVVDGNTPQETLDYVLDVCAEKEIAGKMQLLFFFLNLN